MTEIKLGEKYHVSELRMAGYSPVKVDKFETPSLIERFGSEAITYRRGSDNCLVVKDSGLLKVIALFNSGKGKRADIFRGEKK